MLAAGGRLPIWIMVGQGLTVFVVDADGGCFDIFFLSPIISLFFLPLLDGWMDDLGFYVHFSRISLISGRWVGNGWLCAMETCLLLKRFPPQAGLESRAARSAGQRLTN